MMLFVSCEKKIELGENSMHPLSIRIKVEVPVIIQRKGQGAWQGHELIMNGRLLYEFKHCIHVY